MRLNETNISPLINSSRVSTLVLASAISCLTRTGPICLYIMFSGKSLANSFKCSQNWRGKHFAGPDLFHKLVFWQLRFKFLSNLYNFSQLLLQFLEVARGRLKFASERHIYRSSENPSPLEREPLAKYVWPDLFMLRVSHGEHRVDIAA